MQHCFLRTTRTCPSIQSLFNNRVSRSIMQWSRWFVFVTFNKVNKWVIWVERLTQMEAWLKKYRRSQNL